MKVWLVAMLAIGAGCANPAPRALEPGTDACTHCQMTVADLRFGGELVTRKGRVLPFDDAGCLATWLVTGGTPEAEVHTAYVVDYLAPGSLLPAMEAIFLRSDSLRTPMDYRFIATAPGPRADSLALALGAERLDWDGVLALVGSR